MTALRPVNDDDFLFMMDMKAKIKAIQRAVNVTADGVIGPQTLAAIAARLGLREEYVWPTQAQVRDGSSMFGRAGDENNLMSLVPPYALFYEGKQVKTIRVHKAIAEAVMGALKEVLKVYGPKRIKELGLDQYGGCYNYRNGTNSASLSMHAWGVAIDWAPGKNGYSVKKPYASLSSKDCEAWWEIWEKYGAVSLGRERDFDWMHVQFARLG